MESLALSLVIGLIAHFVGDYLLQSHWMATLKTTKWLPAIAHGVTYTLPFLFATQSPLALAVICITHIVIDRFRLAKYVVWLKNQVGPSAYRPRWKEPSTTLINTDDYVIYVDYDKQVVCQKSKNEDWSVEYTFREVCEQKAIKIVMHPLLLQVALQINREKQLTNDQITDKTTGMPKSTPAWMGVWLMIILDNTIHVVINSVAIWLF